MPFLYPSQTAGRQTLRPQQGPQGQEMLGIHQGSGGQLHATTGGAVGHPVGQFEGRRGVIIIIQPTPEHGVSGPGVRRLDEDVPTGPRVPGMAWLYNRFFSTLLAGVARPRRSSNVPSTLNCVPVSRGEVQPL